MDLFNKYQFKNTKLIIGNFDETLAKQLNENTFDFIYFDGNHTKKATLEYFKLSLSSIHNDSFFLFDDIYWNYEMKQAWEEIKKHPSVTITVDTYQWGIVFFRKEQQKEHFTIRI
jgi:predicted O-methyltransferase YrrM